jgi:hypothetical protein
MIFFQLLVRSKMLRGNGRSSSTRSWLTLVGRTRPRRVVHAYSPIYKIGGQHTHVCLIGDEQGQPGTGAAAENSGQQARQADGSQQAGATAAGSTTDQIEVQ